MDAFTRAYVEAALWTSTDDNGETLDKDYTTNDIALGCLALMVEDCRRFQSKNLADLSRYTDTKYTPEELGGQDFWLTRNGHGAGFWDGTLPESVGDRLTEAARAFGEFDLYVGDDNLIYGA